jgi:hypothetical protein
MLKIEIRTDDPDLGNYLKAAKIPGLEIEPVSIQYCASTEPSVAGVCFCVVLVFAYGLGKGIGQQLPELLSDVFRKGKKKGYYYKMKNERQEETEGPENILIQMNNYIQQAQININPEQPEKKE